MGTQQSELPLCHAESFPPSSWGDYIAAAEDTEGQAGRAAASQRAYATYYCHQDKGCFYSLWFPQPSTQGLFPPELLYRIIRIGICEANFGVRGWRRGLEGEQCLRFGSMRKEDRGNGPVWDRQTSFPTLHLLLTIF